MRLPSGQTSMYVNILGIRGIPATHGGFETFAAYLAPYLHERGYHVTVYCQDDEGTPGSSYEDEWNGIHRVHFAPKRGGAAGTMEFDLACVRDVMKRPGVDLVLGYNTAVFNILQRLRGRRVVMNMDGIEWKRAKWSFAAKAWFWINEIAGANLCHTAIADHPQIAKHVAGRCFKTPVMIPYGGDIIDDAPEAPVREMGLEPGNYLVSIARIEPENSILELVQAFGRVDTSTSGAQCVVLGRLDPDNAYHQAVRNAAGENVRLVGAIYDRTIVEALRMHAAAYLHGHQVGGTNPSLVEALGAGNAVIAHDNRFNRWTAGEGQLYFTDETEAAKAMEMVLSDPECRAAMQRAARTRHHADFQWSEVLATYEKAIFDL